MIKIILIALTLTLFLTNCDQKSYEVKQEAKIDDGRLLNEKYYNGT